LIWLGVLAAFVGGVSYKFGALAGLGALGGALAVPLLLNNARAAFALWLGVLVIAENTADWNVSLFMKIYEKTPVYFSINFLLLLLATLAVMIDVIRPHVELRLPEPFGPALVLVALAIAFGYANAVLGPGIPKSAVLNSIETYGALLLPPFVVVNVVRTRRDLDRLLAFLAALTVFKAFLGVVAVAGAITLPVIGSGRVSYLAPATNWMTMTYVLVVFAAALSRTRLPSWVWWSTPLVIASFVLGQRRSFWLAAAFSLVLLVLIASGRTGRRLLVPAAAAVALAIYLASATGLVGGVQGTLVTRATSLTPTKVTTNKEDRYRLAELRNVWPAISKHPVAGLGVGVPWPETSPLPFEYPFNHYFTHFAVLYWWMTCGLLGVAAYLLLMGSAVVTGVRLWRHAQDRLLRVVSLGIGLGVLGMMIVELTTTVIGADARGTAVIAVSLGILSVIYQGSRQESSLVAPRARIEDLGGPTPYGTKITR
jgi:O-antigen ligase